MAKTLQELYNIQTEIFKQISSNLYDYTTISKDDKFERILELMLNWIACEMEIHKLMK